MFSVFIWIRITIMVAEDEDLSAIGQELRNMLKVALRLANQKVMVSVSGTDTYGILQTLDDQVLKRLAIF